MGTGMSDTLQESNGHSIFAPSYSATFLNCAGSLIPSIAAEDNAGWEAAEGTVFHDLINEWQNYGRPDDWLGDIKIITKKNGDIFSIEVVEDMFSYAEICLEKYKDIPGDRFYETRVDISSITPIPDQGGTADLAICSIGCLDIIDWKYGTGVQVWALHNTQILFYAWGFFQEYDWIYNFQRIQLHIAQPRFNHFDVWEITREELIQFAAYAKEKNYEAWEPNAPRTASPKACMWCKVRLTCPAFEAARQALCDLSFETLDEPVTLAQQKEIVALNSPPPSLEEPVNLPTAQIERILSYQNVMEKWFGDCRAELLSRGLGGHDLTLWKVVNGRNTRTYIGEEDEIVARYMRLGLTEEEIYIRKLKSPNQMEPELRKIGIRGKLMRDWLRTLAPSQPGRPTLAPAGDNRAEIPQIADDVFETLD